MAILHDEADAGEVFPRLRAEMSLCTGLVDARPSAEARGRWGFVLSGMLGSCSLLGRRRNMYQGR